MFLAPDITLENLDQTKAKLGLFPNFPPEMETQYRGEVIATQRGLVAISWLIGLLLYDSFLLNDYLVTGTEFNRYFIGRIGICTPICLVLIYCIYFIDRYHDIFICAMPLVLSAVLSSLLILSHGQYRSNYLFGDILLLICGSVISRPRLPYAAATVGLQCLCFEAVLQATNVVPDDSAVVSTLFCISGGVVAIMTSYALEQLSRRGFVLGLRVRLLNRELEAIAMTDPLTGLGNRRRLEAATARFWTSAASDPKTAAVWLHFGKP